MLSILSAPGRTRRGECRLTNRPSVALVNLSVGIRTGSKIRRRVANASLVNELLISISK